MNTGIHNSKLNIDLNDCIQYFYDCGTIDLCDVRALPEEALMNKILSKVHPFAISYDSNKDRYYTYLTDESRPSGRKQVCRKTKFKLESFLLHYYKVGSLVVYTFRSLYAELMEYECKFKSPSTVTAYIKAYKRHYADDPIIDVDLTTIKPIDMEMWLKGQIEKYHLDYKAYSKMSVLFSEMYRYANRKEYIFNNPFDHINVKQLGLYPSIVKKSEQRVFTKSEIKDIYQIAFDDFSSKPYPVPLAVILIFQTGLRIGEAVALK